MVSPHPVVLGLLAAATWGAADFAGGLATRRAPPAKVVLLAHGASLLILLAASWRLPAQLAPQAVAVALLSGIAGGAALMAFYRALALGAMGLSAALAGLLTAVLPVALAIRNEGLPAPPQLAGFAVAVAAIALIAYAPPVPGAGSRTGRRALLLSACAGVGFGLQLILLHSAGGGPAAEAPGPDRFHAGLPPLLRALTLSRLGGTGIALTALLLSRRSERASLAGLPAVPARAALLLPALAILAGLLDTAGNGLYMLSSLAGRLDVAAVLSSLYPGGTILLAAVLLRERATRLQALGMALALVAVGLIAA